MIDDMIKDTIKLGSRLQTIASFVPQGSRLGDIGTDHAYLPVYLMQNGIIDWAVGVDIHKGPYESAQQTIRMYGLEERIVIRLGNGLAPLKAGEIATLVIAGMGGTTILKILQSKPQVLQGVSTLILQPQGAEARVRQEVTIQGWKLKDESLVEEDGRVYSVMVFSRDQYMNYEDIQDFVRNTADSFNEYIRKEHQHGMNKVTQETIDIFINKYVWTFGPIILKNKGQYLQSVIIDNMATLENIIQEMRKTTRDEIKAKSKLVEQERKLLEVMQRWLFQ